MDRAEATGFGVAALGHAALIAALSLGFTNAVQLPLTNPPIEVSFVDEVGFQSAATEIATEPPAQSVAPELGAPEDAASQSAMPTPDKAQPEKPSANQPDKAKQTKGSSLGDILKGIGRDPTPSKAQKPASAAMSAEAMSSITAAIQRQIQPCANRQVNPGPGANRITVRLNLKLNRDGSLAARPVVAGTLGVDNENNRYEERVKDLAIAAFTGCSPLLGLPEELYDVPRGWSNFIFRYKLP
jgi:hypothetical protein